eukprot:COSAG01_NODE_57085_length_314_cov_1.209302_1_plen_71_part_01
MLLAARGRLLNVSNVCTATATAVSQSVTPSRDRLFDQNETPPAEQQNSVNAKFACSCVPAGLHMHTESGQC